MHFPLVLMHNFFLRFPRDVLVPSLVLVCLLIKKCILKTLLSHFEEGQTALHIAAAKHHDGCVHLLNSASVLLYVSDRV